MEPRPKVEVGSRDSPDPVTPRGSFRDVNNFILLHFPPHVNIYATAHANRALTHVHHHSRRAG
jgi:hypothetical protein